MPNEGEETNHPFSISGLVCCRNMITLVGGIGGEGGGRVARTSAGPQMLRRLLTFLTSRGREIAGGNAIDDAAISGSLIGI